MYVAITHYIRFYNLTKVTHIWMKHSNYSDSSTFSLKKPKVKETAGHTDRDQPGHEVTVTASHVKAVAWTQERLTGSSCGS